MLWASVVEHGHGKKKSKWISSFFPFVIREYGKDWCRHRKQTQHFRDQQPAIPKSWHTSRIPRFDFRVLDFVSFSRLVRKSPARICLFRQFDRHHSNMSATAVDHAATQASSSTSLEAAKRNLQFLYDPNSPNAPTRRRTRALLRTLRYIGKFLFWRLVRYAKYAAVGAITAAIAGTAIGSVASGAAFVIAPTGIVGGAGVGLLWGLGKFGWRTLARKVRSGEAHDSDARADEKAEEQKTETIKPPKMDEPW